MFIQTLDPQARETPKKPTYQSHSELRRFRRTTMGDQEAPIKRCWDETGLTVNEVAGIKKASVFGIPNYEFPSHRPDIKNQLPLDKLPASTKSARTSFIDTIKKNEKWKSGKFYLEPTDWKAV